MIKTHWFIFLFKCVIISCEPTTEHSECTTVVTRNRTVLPNETLIDLSAMDTAEMNTREQAAYAEKKFLETLRDGELGSWGGVNEPSDQELLTAEVNEYDDESISRKNESVFDVFWRMERKMMDEVQIDGPARNDSRGIELPPPPAHVRARRRKRRRTTVATVRPGEEMFDHAGEEYYDDATNYKPISRKKDGGQRPDKRPMGGLHANQTSRGYRSRQGLLWLNQPPGKFDQEDVTDKPSPKRWTNPTSRTHNYTSGSVRRSGVQYITRARPRGGRLRFSRKRNSSN